jgi:replicative DNA helicase
MDLGLLTAKIAKAKQDGIEDIFIDHFGEIPNPEKANEELGNAIKIRTIRNTAKSLGLRVYLLVQFRKASNGLALSKPTLSDIKGSSVIGECAAITLFLHAQEEGRFVLIEKARNAGVGEVAMDYFGPCFTWSSLDGGSQDSFEFDANNFGVHTSHEQDQHPDTEFDQFSAF